MDAHDVNHAVIQFWGVFKSGFYVNRSAAKLRPHIVVELPAEFDKIQISSLFHFGQSAAVAKVREQAIEKIALRHPQVPANVFQATALYFHEAASDDTPPKGLDESLPFLVVLGQIHGHSNASIWWFHQMEEAERHELDIHHVNRLKT